MNISNFSGIAFIGALSAAVLSLGFIVGTPARADVSCLSKTFGCTEEEKVQQSKLDMAELSAVLRDGRYPMTITATSQDELQRASVGWGVRPDCYDLSAEELTKDPDVNNAKVMYCEFRKQGFLIQKPEIVKAF